MSDDEPTADVTLTIEDGFQQGYLHGLMSAMYGQEPEEPCEGCSCGLDDPTAEYEEVVGPVDLELNEMVRFYLEDLGLVTEDDLVKQVVVCPEELRATVRRR